jgi:hypothetical protein
MYFANGGESPIHIDVHSWKAGVYFIRIHYTSGEFEVKKIIKT